MLAPFEGLAIRVRGDGRDYACDLRESATVSGSGVAWKAYFTTAPRVSVDLWLPFVAFEPTWRGTVVRQRGGGAESTFHHTIHSLGFTIAALNDARRFAGLRAPVTLVSGDRTLAAVKASVKILSLIHI